MTQPGAGAPPGRALRGAALGLAGWYTVVVAHVAASGSLPSIGSVVTSGGLAALVGVGLAGRRWTWRRAFVALLLLQPTLHLALTALAAGHHHHATATSGPGAVMAIFHVTAAAVAALILSRGEGALLRLATLLATTWRIRPAAVPVTRAWSTLLVVTPATLPLITAQVRWSLRRRGPPTPARTS